MRTDALATSGNKKIKIIVRFLYFISDHVYFILSKKNVFVF